MKLIRGSLSFCWKNFVESGRHFLLVRCVCAWKRVYAWDRDTTLRKMCVSVFVTRIQTLADCPIHPRMCSFIFSFYCIFFLFLSSLREKKRVDMTKWSRKHINFSTTNFSHSTCLNRWRYCYENQSNTTFVCFFHLSARSPHTNLQNMWCNRSAMSWKFSTDEGPDKRQVQRMFQNQWFSKSTVAKCCNVLKFQNSVHQRSSPTFWRGTIYFELLDLIWICLSCACAYLQETFNLPKKLKTPLLKHRNGELRCLGVCNVVKLYENVRMHFHFQRVTCFDKRYLKLELLCMSYLCNK